MSALESDEQVVNETVGLEENDVTNVTEEVTSNISPVDFGESSDFVEEGSTQQPRNTNDAVEIKSCSMLTMPLNK